MGEACAACPVWTGTLTDGSASGQDCAEWVSMVGEMPTVGDCGSSDLFWTERCMGQSTGCIQAAHLYCFEKGLP